MKLIRKTEKSDPEVKTQKNISKKNLEQRQNQSFENVIKLK